MGPQVSWPKGTGPMPSRARQRPPPGAGAVSLASVSVTSRGYAFLSPDMPRAGRLPDHRVFDILSRRETISRLITPVTLARSSPVRPVVRRLQTVCRRIMGFLSALLSCPWTFWDMSLTWSNRTACRWRSLSPSPSTPRGSDPAKQGGQPSHSLPASTPTPSSAAT